MLSDIVQNSVEAGSKHVGVRIEEYRDRMVCTVTDDGKGMDEATLGKAMDPFHTDGIKHARRKVGLGLPFLLQTVEAVGGTCDVQSQPGTGTVVRYMVRLDHVDCPPLGDMSGTIMALLAFPGSHEMVVERMLDLGNRSDFYTLNKTELAEVVGELTTGGALTLLRAYVQSQETALDELREPSLWERHPEEGGCNG